MRSLPVKRSKFNSSGRTAQSEVSMAKPADQTICYCFSHTRGDIEKDVLRNGRSLILEKIIAAKRLGTCQCTMKNPKGT